MLDFDTKVLIIASVLKKYHQLKWTGPKQMKAIYKVRTESNQTKLIIVDVKSGGHAALIAKKIDTNPNIKHTMLIQTDIDEVLEFTESCLAEIS